MPAVKKKPMGHQEDLLGKHHRTLSDIPSIINQLTQPPVEFPKSSHKIPFAKTWLILLSTLNRKTNELHHAVILSEFAPLGKGEFGLSLVRNTADVHTDDQYRLLAYGCTLKLKDLGIQGCWKPDARHGKPIKKSAMFALSTTLEGQLTATRVQPKKNPFCRDGTYVVRAPGGLEFWSHDRKRDTLKAALDEAQKKGHTDQIAAFKNQYKLESLGFNGKCKQRIRRKKSVLKTQLPRAIEQAKRGHSGHLGQLLRKALAYRLVEKIGQKRADRIEAGRAYLRRHGWANSYCGPTYSLGLQVNMQGGPVYSKHILRKTFGTDGMSTPEQIGREGYMEDFDTLNKEHFPVEPRIVAG